MPELKYVAYLHHNINRERIPTKEEFKTMQLQSLNVKEKFRELKDVTDGVFADLVVRLVSEPHFMGDKATIWVSDYTENPAFFNFTAIGTNDGDFHDGDAFGYTSKNLKKQQAKKRQGQDTRGPFGKRKMQITCWDPHTSAIRQEDIKRGTWVEMKNVQIKYGNNGANLEGFLREDRKAHGIKIGIFALEIDDRDYMSEKLVNAIKRHRDYDRSKKAQLDDIQDAALAGQKRKRQLEAGKTTTAPNGENAKVRRQKQRAEQKGKKAKAEKNMGDGNTEAAPVQAPAAPEPPQPKPPANLNTQGTPWNPL